MDAANPGITGVGFAPNAPGVAKWRVYHAGNQYYLQLEGGLSKIYCYQSDINDLTNKWIPYGVLDNSRKSVVRPVDLNATAASYASLEGYFKYEVKPTNDYFLNCYWTD